jgi:hypothetical protein
MLAVLHLADRDHDAGRAKRPTELAERSAAHGVEDQVIGFGTTGEVLS